MIPGATRGAQAYPPRPIRTQEVPPSTHVPGGPPSTSARFLFLFVVLNHFPMFIFIFVAIFCVLSCKLARFRFGRGAPPSPLPDGPMRHPCRSTSSPPPACSISAPASQHTTQIPQKGSTGSGPEDQRAPRATTRLLWLPKLCYVLLCVCLAWRCSVLIRGCVTFYSVLVCFVVLSSVSLRH